MILQKYEQLGVSTAGRVQHQTTCLDRIAMNSTQTARLRLGFSCSAYNNEVGCESILVQLSQILWHGLTYFVIKSVDKDSQQTSQER